MTRNLLAYTAVFLLALPTAGPAELSASDRLAAGFPPGGSIQGEIVDLNDGAGGFMAIYQRTTLKNRRGGIVLLHDQGTNANSLEVIRPLRLGLPSGGWDTLSLQLPQALQNEDSAAWRSRQAPIQARLQAALDWLRQHQMFELVIVALGDSGAIALQYASAEPPPEGLRALVMVSTSLDASGAQALGKLQLPALDVFAESDRPPVVDGAAERRGAAATDESGPYTQSVISGARPGFFGMEESLLGRIRGWLAVNARGAGGLAR